MPVDRSIHSPGKIFARWYALIAAMLGMAVTFAVWAALSPLAPLFQFSLGLTHTEVSIIIAIPVLLGSVMRIPVGILTDRFGGKRVFLGLLVFSLVPTLVLGTSVSSFRGLVGWALILGLAGTSFAVGIPYVSKWFPPGRQGLALGLFGMGNGGTAIASFYGPRIAQASDWHHVFLVFAVPIILVLLLFIFAKDAPQAATERKTWANTAKLLYANPLVWLLSFFYFITFGSFVALSNYIPKLMADTYGLTHTSCGTVAAVFVIMATLGRPAGGWLSDRFGGRRILKGIFTGIGLAGILLTFTMPPSTYVLLIYGLGLLAGIGNGSVFKLVPQYFKNDTGVATGIIGAAGGLGGFFPPLFLGIFRDQLGSYTPGFLFLTVFCLLSLFTYSFSMRQYPSL